MKKLMLTESGLTEVKRTKLQKNQILFFNGQCVDREERWAVYEIENNQWGTQYKIVNIDQPALTSVADVVRSEKEIFGIGHYYFDPIIFCSDEQIEDGLIMANQFARQKAIEKVQKEQAENELAKKLKKEYSYLEQTNGKISSYKLAAKNIRKELKKELPGIKFRTRTDGNSFDIYYEIDLTEEELEVIKSIVNRYKMGSFDGMQDMYIYTRSVFTKLFGGFKYVGHRKIDFSVL